MIPVAGIFSGILNGILDIPFLLLDGLVDIFNAFISAIAVLAQGFLNLLPAFPAAPDPPSEGILGFLTWLVPLGGLLVTFAALMGVWIAFLAFKVVLSWVKAL